MPKVLELTGPQKKKEKENHIQKLILIFLIKGTIPPKSK